jgi:hypothetical protein
MSIKLNYIEQMWEFRSLDVNASGAIGFYSVRWMANVKEIYHMENLPYILANNFYACRSHIEGSIRFASDLGAK